LVQITTTVRFCTFGGALLVIPCVDNVGQEGGKNKEKNEKNPIKYYK
jgi:hypothetical protein